MIQIFVIHVIFNLVTFIYRHNKSFHITHFKNIILNNQFIIIWNCCFFSIFSIFLNVIYVLDIVPTDKYWPIYGIKLIASSTESGFIYCSTSNTPDTVARCITHPISTFFVYITVILIILLEVLITINKNLLWTPSFGSSTRIVA